MRPFFPGALPQAPSPVALLFDVWGKNWFARISVVLMATTTGTAATRELNGSADVLDQRKLLQATSRLVLSSTGYLIIIYCPAWEITTFVHKEVTFPQPR